MLVLVVLEYALLYCHRKQIALCVGTYLHIKRHHEQKEIKHKLKWHKTVWLLSLGVVNARAATENRNMMPAMGVQLVFMAFNKSRLISASTPKRLTQLSGKHEAHAHGVPGVPHLERNGEEEEEKRYHAIESKQWQRFPKKINKNK